MNELAASFFQGKRVLAEFDVELDHRGVHHFARRLGLTDAASVGPLAGAQGKAVRGACGRVGKWWWTGGRVDGWQQRDGGGVGGVSPHAGAWSSFGHALPGSGGGELTRWGEAYQAEAAGGGRGGVARER